MKFLIAALPLVLVMFAGCTTGPEFVEPPMKDGKYIVTMTSGFSFSPSKIEVPANSTIVFVYKGSGPWHDVTSATGAWERSPRIQGDTSWELTLTEPGTYEYYCTPHKSSGMTGTIRVV